MFGALSMSFANVTTREVSKTDTAATVHVTGDMTINVDKEKFKTVWKTMMQAQGQPVDDATIDAIVGQMATSISTTQKLDEDIKVVNEGGKWLLCE
jgi:CRISPR/Cas system CMR subunit Cmr4 (Cas7 group RAMP superfamily)